MILPDNVFEALRSQTVGQRARCLAVYLFIAAE